MSKLSVVMITGIALLLGGGQSTPAATKSPSFYVGTCKPGKADFTTIQAAVSAVPPGSTINVCPGVYPEQVTITQPLTLQGVQSGDNAQVMIAAPAGGTVVATVPVAVPVIALVAVSNSGGAVDISGLTVDGTGITAAGSQVTGFLYNSSPGTLNQVVVQNLALTNIEATGILVRDDSAVSPTNIIQNSVISFPSTSSSTIVQTDGLRATTEITEAQTPALSGGTITLSVTNNVISGANAAVVIDDSVAATVTGNAFDGTTLSNTQTLSFAGAGVFTFGTSAPVKISNNSILNFVQGIVLQRTTGSTVVSNNSVVSSDAGIFLVPPIAAATTINGNQLVTPANVPQAAFAVREIGIDFGCSAPLPTTSGNTIIGALVGLGNVPGGVSVQKNAGTFINVPEVEQLCQ
jgi:hypothetical protein